MKNEFAQASASSDFLVKLKRRRAETTEPSDYPRCKYGANGAVRVVQSSDAEEELGEGWFNSPADVPEAPAPEASAPAVDPHCASCARLSAELEDQTARYTRNYTDRTTENAQVLKENADLREQLSTANAHKESVQQHLDVAAGKLKAAEERIAVLEQEAAAPAPVVPEPTPEKPSKRK